MPWEDSVISLLSSHLDLNFEASKETDSSRYANGDDIRLVIVGPIALFSNFKLTTSSGNHLEDISHIHIVCLLYKLINSGKNSDNLANGFDRDRDRKQRELSNNKNTKSENHVWIMPKDLLGFAEKQEKAAFGLGYKLTLTRNNADTVLQLTMAINDAGINNDLIHWYIHQHTPSIQQQGI